MANTQIKRLYQGTSEFVPITLSEAVVVNTDVFNESTWQEITTLDKVLKKIYGETVSLDAIVDNINSQLVNKQDKLTAGTGISIVNGVISCTSNVELYQIVASMTDLNSMLSTATFNKIYLVKGGNTNQNQFAEFILVNDNGTRKWEQIGTVQTSVDLSGYVTKTEYDSKIATIESSMITAKDVTLSNNSNYKIVVNYNIPNNLYDSMIQNDTDNIIGG